MADLVLKNLDQAIMVALEQGAKRLGITVEAAAIRALNRPVASLEEAFEERPSPSDFEAFLMGEGEGSESPAPGTAAAVTPAVEDGRRGGSAPGAERTLGERQAALAGAYPDEYVVLAGERIVVHTSNRDEAYARYQAAFAEAGGVEPIVVAPSALRRHGPPVLRGRGLPRHRETKQ